MVDTGVWAGSSASKATDTQMREWVKDPIIYRFRYNDGLKGTILLMNGLVNDFTFAARLEGQKEPLSTLFYLPPNPNVTYSAALMSESRRDVHHREGPLPGRANFAHQRPCRSRRSVAGPRKTNRNALHVRPLRSTSRVHILANIADRRLSSSTITVTI